jgi:isopentenyl phosphate kinase
MMSETIFLKLGGSLITDKDKEQTALVSRIDQIAVQIKDFCDNNPEVRLLVGHGSGSFGHYAAKRFHTRDGVQTPEQWNGFSAVWQAAHLLDRIVVDRFSLAGIPVISLSLSAAAVTSNRKIRTWNTLPIQSALENHLLPIIFGDVVLDYHLGGTILSTEEQFAELVPVLHPDRILLAGLEPGVWEDFPKCTRMVSMITPKTYPEIAAHILGSASVDVTGGMTAKVQDMLSLIKQDPHLRVQIFSGLTPENITAALSDETLGTVIKADK